MEIICGKMCGFCSGVEYSINKAFEILKYSQDKIYCLGQIVHNEWVIHKLENYGMTIVNNIDDVPNNVRLIIRAHGEPKETINKAISKKIELINLTCGKIKVITNKIEKEKQNSFIVIVGKKNHPETIGLLSYAGQNSNIIENYEDISSVCKQIKEKNFGKIYVVSQTTFSGTKFDILTDELKKNFGDKTNIIINKTICDATEKRQKEAQELSKYVDKMIVVGGKNSSNTRELYEIASKYCSKSYLIQTVEDLKDEKFYKTDKVGIISGTSTHKYNINEIIEYLKN